VRLSAYDPSITGALVYADTFWAFDCVGLRGDLLESFRG
jgi:putative acetyltransferase